MDANVEIVYKLITSDLYCLHWLITNSDIKRDDVFEPKARMLPHNFGLSPEAEAKVMRQRSRR